jgi:hypothetical protein
MKNPAVSTRLSILSLLILACTMVSCICVAAQPSLLLADACRNRYSGDPNCPPLPEPTGPPTPPPPTPTPTASPCSADQAALDQAQVKAAADQYNTDYDQLAALQKQLELVFLQLFGSGGLPPTDANADFVDQLVTKYQSIQAQQAALVQKMKQDMQDYNAAVAALKACEASAK